MSYNASDEAKFQKLKNNREASVRRLRVALEKAGVREFVQVAPVQLAGGLGGGQIATPQRVVDIENVIKNARELRDALADFDSGMPTFRETGEVSRPVDFLP